MKLLEKPSDVPLQQWNDIQITLWSDMVTKGYVDKNNIEVFLDFGKYIDQFYYLHHFFPTSDDILIELGFK